MPEIVQSLIHGTGARGAWWTQPYGPVAANLTRLLAPLVVEVLDPPLWSGRNRIMDRVVAADALREHISHVALRFPTAHHVIVAHSHGGNAAMYALTSVEARQRVHGLICLSTPFLIFRPRMLRWDVAHLLPFSVAVVPMLLAILVGSITGLDMANKNTQAVFFIGGIACFLAAQRGYSWIMRRFFARLPPLNTAAIHEWCADNLSYPAPADMPVLILRASGDEASGALSAARMMSWVTEKVYYAFGALPRFVENLWGYFAKFIDPSWSVRNTVLGFAYIGLLAGFVYLTVNEVVSYNVGEFLLVGLLLPLFIGGLSTILLLLLAFFLVCLIPLMGIWQMAFGWEAAVWSPICEVTAEASPPGEYRVVQLSSVPAGASYSGPSSGELWHSEPYKDPRAVEIMAEWIKSLTANTIT